MKAQKRRGGSKHPKSVSSDASVLEYKGSDLYVPSDSEDEYSEQEKILLGKVRSNLSRSVVKKKLAVMDIPLDDEDNEDEMEEDSENIEDDVDMDSDIEGKDEDFHLPDQKAWGKTRKNFYNTDYVDQDYGGFDGDDAETAELEEQEALAIQKRLAAELDDNDFTLDVFTKSHEDVKAVEKHSEEVIKTDLSQLSTRQKLALLQKEAPELTGIISEFRDVMEDLQNNLQPAMALVLRGQVSSPELIQYIRTKYHLLNNYALNMGFYLLLRARRLPVSAHPVVKRLLQYRQLLQQLDPLNKLAVSQIEELLNAWKNGSLLTLQGNDLHDMKIKNKEQPIFLSRIFRKGEWAEPNNVGSTPQVSPITRDRHKVITKGINEQASPEMSQENSLDLDRNEDLLTHEVTSGDEMANVIGSEDLVGSLEDAEVNSKRGITWQIAKNKGLTPHRKKEQRNPRVKHRNKFRKAKIRRKGQVREPRTEIKRYGGEFSGIKKCVSKSIKIK